MSRITIINGDDGDDVVVVDGRAQYFPLTGLLDDEVWAIQWFGDKGEVELRGNTIKRIESMDEYSPVLDEFNRLCDIEDNPPPPTDEEKQEMLSAVVQAHMDQKAREYDYDNIVNAITYADEPAVAKFQAEGKAFRAWRSTVWEECYSLLAQWQAGEIGEISGEALIAQLPVFTL